MSILQRAKNIVRLKEKLKLFIMFSYISLISIKNSYGTIYGDNLAGEGSDFGSDSSNMAQALFSISNLWLAIATIAGLGFLFVGVVKYHEHRKNPIQTPLSHVFTMLFLAIALIGIAFIVQFGDSSYAAIKRLFY